jgi:xanthine dehydrogenase accessory factor
MSLNRATRRTAEAWLAEGRTAVVIVVLETRGSAPRRSGTRMVVSASQAVGTVGGGHLELKAIDEARAMLSGGVPPHEVHYPLGPALGQCCGGAMTLGFTRLDAQALAAWPNPKPLFHLQLYGAGHVGTAIARLLATLDVSVDWIDEREEMFPFALSEGTPWPEHIRVVPVDEVWGEVALAPPEAYYLVLTHSHDLDLRITQTILRRGDFGYLGLIGSKTKRARFVHRFEAMGIPMQRIARMTCPIGIEGITAKEPEIIAVSVVAQLLQE